MPTYLNPEDGMDPRQIAAFRAATNAAASKDEQTAIADTVNRVTGSEPVRGEDLLPPELQEEYAAAKKKLAAKPVRVGR